MRGRILQIAIKVNSEYKTIAQCTSHKLSISAQTSDTTTKDMGKVKEVTGRSWSFSTDNLICNYTHSNNSGIHAYNLLKDYIKGAELEIRLQYLDAALPETDENEGNNTGPSPTTLLTGKVRISKMDLNFQNKENASYTAEFKGIGKPTVVDASGGSESVPD